jgi:hypothetical protein
MIEKVTEALVSVEGEKIALTKDQMQTYQYNHAVCQSAGKDSRCIKYNVGHRSDLSRFAPEKGEHHG